MTLKAMVFAAGTGSRLKEIGKLIPKALVPVNGEPMLKRILLKLKAAGVEEVVINLFHLGEQIKEYLAANDNFGLKIHFSEEETLLNTGGGLRRAANFFSESDTVLVHNCDIYTTLNLKSLVETHEQSGAIASLALSSRQSSRVLLVSPLNELAGWRNKKSGEEIAVLKTTDATEKAYAGIQVISGEFFPFLRNRDDAFWIFHAYFDAVRAGERVNGIDIGDILWWDIGTPERLERLHTLLETGNLGF